MEEKGEIGPVTISCTQAKNPLIRKKRLKVVRGNWENKMEERRRRWRKKAKADGCVEKETVQHLHTFVCQKALTTQGFGKMRWPKEIWAQSMGDKKRLKGCDCGRSTACVKEVVFQSNKMDEPT